MYMHFQKLYLYLHPWFQNFNIKVHYGILEMHMNKYFYDTIPNSMRLGWCRHIYEGHLVSFS
jgi:hypothetical protein